MCETCSLEEGVTSVDPIGASFFFELGPMLGKLAVCNCSAIDTELEQASLE